MHRMVHYSPALQILYGPYGPLLTSTQNVNAKLPSRVVLGPGIHHIFLKYMQSKERLCFFKLGMSNNSRNLYLLETTNSCGVAPKVEVF